MTVKKFFTLIILLCGKNGSMVPKISSRYRSENNFVNYQNKYVERFS